MVKQYTSRLQVHMDALKRLQAETAAELNALLANASGDQARVEAELRACFVVLASMKQRGLHFDPQLAHFYEQLREMLGNWQSSPWHTIWAWTISTIFSRPLVCLSPGG